MAPSRRGRRRGRRGALQGAEYLLDLFTHADLRTWNAASEAYETFHVRLFFHLESQRKLNHDELCEALEDSTAVSTSLKNWVRIVDYQYCMNPLSVRGSIIKGGRFNIGEDLGPKRFSAFPALYLADRYETAYAETRGAPLPKTGHVFSGQEFGLRTPASFTSIKISGHAENLFDLRRAKNLKPFVEVISSFEMPDDLKDMANALRIKEPWLITTPGLLKTNLLAKEWRSWPTQFEIPANPQAFGRLLVDAGFEGVIYHSAQTRSNCVALYPQNLTGSESFVEIADPCPEGIEFTRLDANTWPALTS